MKNVFLSFYLNIVCQNFKMSRPKLELNVSDCKYLRLINVWKRNNNRMKETGVDFTNPLAQ